MTLGVLHELTEEEQAQAVLEIQELAAKMRIGSTTFSGILERTILGAERNERIHYAHEP